MKFLRTKNNTIIPDLLNEVFENQPLKYETLGIKVINQAERIEDLIQDGDMIYIHDLYPDVVLVVNGQIKPFGYNSSIKLGEWLKSESIAYDLYVKEDSNTFKKVASKTLEDTKLRPVYENLN